eukprot:g1181.t1
MKSRRRLFKSFQGAYSELAEAKENGDIPPECSAYDHRRALDACAAAEDFLWAEANGLVLTIDEVLALINEKSQDEVLPEEKVDVDAGEVQEEDNIEHKGSKENPAERDMEGAEHEETDEGDQNQGYSDDSSEEDEAINGWWWVPGESECEIDEWDPLTRRFLITPSEGHSQWVERNELFHPAHEDWDTYVVIAEAIDEMRQLALMNMALNSFCAHQPAPKRPYLPYQECVEYISASPKTKGLQGWNFSRNKLLDRLRPKLSAEAKAIGQKALLFGLPQCVYARRVISQDLDYVKSEVYVTSRHEWHIRGVYPNIVAERGEQLQRSHLFGVPGFDTCVLLAAHTDHLWSSPRCPFDISMSFSHSGAVALTRYNRNLAALSQQISGSLNEHWRKNVAVKARDVVEEWLSPLLDDVDKYRDSIMHSMVTRLEIQMRESLIVLLKLSGVHFNTWLQNMQKQLRPIVSADLLVRIKGQASRRKDVRTGGKHSVKNESGKEVRLKPTLEKIVESIGSTVETLVSTISSKLRGLVGIVMPMLTEYGDSRQLLQGREFSHEFDKIYRRNLAIIERTRDPAQAVVNKFDRWLDDVENAAILPADIDNMTAVAKLQELVTLQKELPSLAADVQLVGGILELNTVTAKRRLSRKVAAEIKRVSSRVYSIIRGQNEEALSEHRKGFELLTKEPKDSFELRKQIDLGCANDGIDNFIKPICVNIVLPTARILNDLHEIGLRTPQELLDSFDEVLRAPSKLFAAAKVFESRRSALVEQFSSELLRQTDKLREDVSSLHPTIKKFESCDLLTGRTGLSRLGDIEENVHRVEVLEHHLQVALDKQKQIDQSTGILNLTPHNFTFLKSTTDAANAHITLWKIAISWKESEAEWMMKPFKTTFKSAEGVKKRVVSWLGSLQTLSATFERSNFDGPKAIVGLLQRSIKAFTKHLPTIELLRHKGVKKRHWDEMLGPDRYRESLSLNEILDLKVPFQKVVRNLAIALSGKC